MIVFIALVFLLIAIALFFVLPPLMGRYKVSSTQHNELNLAIYQQRLTELDDSNNANLSDEQKVIARKELETSLGQDLQDEVADDSSTATTLVKEKNPLLISIIAVSIPLLALFLYALVGPAELPEILMGQAISQQQTVNDAHGQQQPDIKKMVASLEKKLQENPDNAEGWQMLARSYMYMQRFNDATEAYKKAVSLGGDDPQVLADYAEAIAMQREGNMQGEPTQLVLRALEANNMHPKSLWLAGAAHIQTGQYQKAIDYWQRLMTLHQAGTEGAIELQKRIDMAKQAMQENGQTPMSNDQTQPAATNETQITVTVDLAPALKAKASPEDTLFILARALNGPPMPLAISRKQVKDLPVTVTLDDSMAMTPQARMSNFEKVYIRALIAKSGMAKTEPGDLDGRSAIIETGSTITTTVTIDHEVE